MSAFIVEEAHIDALVQAGLSIPFGPLRIRGKALTSETATWFGRRLWAENIKSVRYRYPGTPLPDPHAYRFVSAHPYGFVSAARFVSAGRDRTPVEILKAIDCYEFQSSEHPAWPRSFAWAFCEALRRSVIHCLPGYDEASWAIGG